MRCRKWLLVAVVLGSFAVGSCVQTDKGTQLRPDVAAGLDRAAGTTETLAPLLPLVSAFWPPAAAIGGILAGLIGMWKKLKPQVTEAQDEAYLNYTVVAALVESIEKWKEGRPDDWAYLKTKLEKAIGPKAEAVIRALRNLPPKE